MRSSAWPSISMPRKNTRPVVGVKSPDRRLISVVLPAPLGPITAWICLGDRSSETSRTAARPPKFLPSASARRIGSDTASLAHCAPQRGRIGQALRQEQNGGDDEQSHRQQPMGGEIAEKIFQ